MPNNRCGSGFFPLLGLVAGVGAEHGCGAKAARRQSFAHSAPLQHQDHS